jgi:AmmeMemoRadiSam system protein A
MGKIIASYILPHPPLAVPEVGRGSEKDIADTVGMMQRAAKEIKYLKPDTIIVISPHAPVHRGGGQVHIHERENLAGDLSSFRAPGVNLVYKNDTELVAGIIREAEAAGYQAGSLTRLRGLSVGGGRSGFASEGVAELDHGTVVPLYYIDKEFRGAKLVVISISFMESDRLYGFGKCVKRAVQKHNTEGGGERGAGGGGRCVIIASGDLSHKLKDDGPYGFDPAGPEFDRFFVECIQKKDIQNLLDIDVDFLEAAAQCGYYSAIIMLGAHSGEKIRTEVYSYEGPFGVGYCVARIEPVISGNDGDDAAEYSKSNSNVSCEDKAGDKPKPDANPAADAGNIADDEYVKLAKRALGAFIMEGRMIEPPKGLPTEMLENRAGVFVSLKKHGNLRGCIGTISPVCDSIAEEIIQNAISSCSRDPRFGPVTPSELSSLTVSVDVLSEAEPVTSKDQLDAKRFGVIVSKGFRRGLLLPNLEGVDTVDEQLAIALQKAGLYGAADYRIERFEVIRHGA